MGNRIYTGAIIFFLITQCSFMDTHAQSASKKYTQGIKEAIVYTTAEHTDYRLTKTDSLKLKDHAQPLETETCVFVDPSKTFQTMIGIGGALTDAAAETFYKLPVDKRKELLTAYYDKNNGIGYTFARTNMQSCDFSSDSYSYVAANDAALKSFDISHDRQYRIPFIKEVIVATGGRLNLFISPWSPPAWMKDNNDVLHGGKLKPEYFQIWANFFVKYIRAYEQESIPIWGLTIQNEPMATQTWESCIYTAEEEATFVKKYLGPTLHKEGLADKKIMIWDHNRDLLYQRAASVLEDADAAKYVWGIAYHWYEGWSGGGMQFESNRRVHEAFPDKPQVFTEGCVDKFDFSKLSDWSMGEKYGLSMINDFNNGTVAWTDWNVLLDERGGPNHVGNYCFAPIHADTKNGALIYTNSYYYIGHFSKFIRPGAKRIACVPSRKKLLSTAFINEDGSIAVVVMNQTNERIPYLLWLHGKAANIISLPHSIQTVMVE